MFTTSQVGGADRRLDGSFGDDQRNVSGLCLPFRSALTGQSTREQIQEWSLGF